MKTSFEYTNTHKILICSFDRSMFTVHGGKCAQLIQNVNPYIHSPYIRAEIKFRLNVAS